MMPRHVPIEICALTFQHITSKAELSNLCMVSRAFRHEAQRILYHTVRLPNDYRRIVSWCRLITKNPRLAMHVFALYLPATCEHRPRFKADLAPQLQALRRVVERALSSLSKLAELHIYDSYGMPYLNSSVFCGHSFRLQVFGEALQPLCTVEHWLKFLSEQPGIRHWRANIGKGHALDPEVLPLLTSAHVFSSALSILTRSPTIRALRIMRRSSLYSDELSGLKAFRYTLTSLSLEYFGYCTEELEIVRDAVPNITFLGLRPQCGVCSLVRSLSEFY
jgi:hypothetical protein